MMRSLLLAALLVCAGRLSLDAQAVCRPSSVLCSGSGRPATNSFQDTQRASFSQFLVHHGKWLTAAATIGFTVMASKEHVFSRREWDALLAMCRTAQDACVVGPDGRYLRADAEALYQRSRSYDLLANRWLVGAQVSLVATTALFIIDLRGSGPENIPYPSQIRVGTVGGGAGVEMRFAF